MAESSADAVKDQGQFEFAFEPVPKEKRKGGFSLFLVLAGYPIAVSNFVTGAAIGYRMTFLDALAAIAVGDAFLIFIAVSTGLISFRTGLSTSFLSRMAFGKKGSTIFSLLLVVSSITWIGINGDTFGKMVIANFPDFPIPAAVLGAAIILVWSISAMRGYKGLEIVSWIGVPTALLLALITLVLAGVNYGGYEAVLSYAPEPDSVMPFTTATASIVGSWVFGCMITPDVCRFAKTKKDTVFAGVGAFVLGLFCLQMVGVVVAQVAKNGDFSGATAAIGLGYLAQNIIDATRLRGKVTHKQVAFLVTLCSAIFAFCGALQWLLPIVQFLSVLMVPIPALIVAEWFFVRKSKLKISANPIAIVCWLLGGVVGQICLSTGFLVPPMVAYVATIVLYTALSKAFDGVVLEKQLERQKEGYRTKHV